MMPAFQGRKLVHLDLKGAPPKMDYLLKLLPHIRQWGATGVLVEYEDMFPYEEDLSFLQRKYAYSKEEIQLLQRQAENENLTFIPLIQTFGHLEFVLKHNKFHHLQEMEGNPMSICPSHKDSLPLVQSLIHQVIEAHEDIKYIHIGGDEVFGLGDSCSRCLERQLSVKDLFLEHMIPLLQYIKSKWPPVKIIMWDDMIREYKVDELQPLSGLVEPMIWGYEDNILDYFPAGMFDRFASVFDDMWIASSFKGSSGPTSDYVPIEHHINNHLSWIQLLYQLPEPTRSKINGIAITGWSRYDHFATICELLPVALPCLALCLATVENEKLTIDLQATVAASLGFSSAVALQGRTSMEGEKGCFPGANICALVGHLEKAQVNLKVGKGRAAGWMTSWHEQERRFNPWHLDFAHTLCQVGMNILTSIKVPLREALLQIYDAETVNEWISIKVESKMQEAQEMLDQIKKNLNSTNQVVTNGSKG